MKKTLSLFIIMGVSMILGYQNCSSGGGGENPAPAAVTDDAELPQSACVDLSFTSTSLIYENSAHVIPDPPIQPKSEFSPKG